MMPSQVAATLISIRLEGIPSSSYIPTICLAFAIVLYLLKLSLADTSVDTLPGIIFLRIKTSYKIYLPKLIASLSQVSSISSLWDASGPSLSLAY